MDPAAFNWAPGLLMTIKSDEPPTISYFGDLPMHLNTWAIYVLVLEKDGRVRVYIRSGTDSRIGVKSRMDQYDRRSKDPAATNGIPHYVEKSMQEGFKITSKGLLAWTSIPRTSEVWRLRCLMRVMEATFTMCFWAMKSQDKDYKMPALCPWAREAFTYAGLWTHFSINEGITGTPTSGTPEEINETAEERRKSKQALYIANKGPGVHAANTKAYRIAALEEQRYRCEICDLSCRSNAKLLEHRATQSHQNKAAGVGRRTAGRGGSQLAVANKKHWCEVCQHAAPSAARLATHLAGPRHAAKLRYFATKAKLEEEQS